MSGQPRQVMLTLFFWQCVGFTLLFAHLGFIVLLGSALIPFAITLIFVTMLYFADSLAAFAVFLVFVLYQNLAISIVSGSLSPDLYRASQATAFALTLALTTAAGYRLWSLGRNRRVLVWLGVAALVILAYTALGAVRSSPGSAAVYFRSSIVGLTGLLIGWDVGRSYGHRILGLCYLTTMALGVGAAVLEVTTPIFYYECINAARYYLLSVSASTSVVFVDLTRAQDVVLWLTNNFFNIAEGSLQTVRFGGPNMHSVSYAYVMSVGAIVAISLGMYWFAIALLPLMFLIGVKGGVILLFSTTILSLTGRWFGPKVLAVTGLVLGTAYVSFAIWFGLSVGDYHIIGLIGGVNGFISNPLGRGIGVGGNLSIDVTSTDTTSQWDLNQLYGSDVALESAIGVLLYQMGVGGVAVGYIIWIAFASGARYITQRSNVLPLAVVVVTVNGLFQEEAFSPYAMGLLTMFAAVLSSDASYRYQKDGRESNIPGTRHISSPQLPAYIGG